MSTWDSPNQAGPKFARRPASSILSTYDITSDMENTETNQTLFSEIVFLFADKQFSDEAIGLLTARIQEYGGTVTEQRQEASALLVNPNHPAFKTEKSHLAFLRDNYKDIPQPQIIPYHWIARCIHDHKLVSPEQLALASPIFTYPSQSTDYRPLRTWVSVNITREGGESPEDAQANCSKTLELGGALIVQKRAQADLLVVDESSQFAKKVHEEKKKYGRDYQRIVERDWVDTCWKEKKLSWRLPIKPDGENEDDGNDSMLEDDVPVKTGKGPGRPTGQPRKDYTGQDDDFLCRFLAAYFPKGSWGSRKTYITLLNMKDTYPPAENHTSQSWHERFKKNSVALEKRIRRFIAEGIDASLKTEREREKAAEQKATQSVTDADEQEAGPSQARPLAAVEGEAIPTSTRPIRPGKRKLVESDDESPPPAKLSTTQQSSKGKDRADPPVETTQPAQSAQPIVATETSGPTATESNDATEPIPNPAPSAIPVAETVQAGTASRAPLGPQLSFGSILPDQFQVEGSNNSADRTVDTDVVERDLLGLADEEEPSQEGRSIPGEETQAILNDFARAKAAASASAAPAPAVAEPSSPVQKPRKLVRLDEEVQFRDPPVLPSQAQTESSAEDASLSRQAEREPSLAQSSPRHIILSPPRHVLQPPSDLVRQRQSMPEPNRDGGLEITPSRNGTTRLSIPLRLEVDVRGVTAGEGVTRIVGAAQTDVAAPTPAEGSGRRSQGQVYETSTPSPATRFGSGGGGRRSLLRDEILNSATKRRRTLDRAAGGGGRRRDESLLDTVYASTVLPSPKTNRSTPTPLASSPTPPPPPPTRRRDPSPPLSEAERSERYFAGKNAVERRRDEYRARLLEFGKLTGWTFSQVATWLGKKKFEGGIGEGEEHWERIRRTLLEEVGRQQGQGA
ncbi:hypothetical protein CI109_100812 [Kwoniella shandongensis]|uniref:BRCT domain-containing protein n=1 Tax=Kwoniella shandongensis TaxID=1734106 RepID=A0AAJ8LFN5_9TREE